MLPGLRKFGDLVGIDILGGIVAILSPSLGWRVAAYQADALVGAAITGLVVRDQAASRSRELALLAAGGGRRADQVAADPGPWVKLAVIVLGLGAVVAAVTRARRSRRGPGATRVASAA